DIVELSLIDRAADLIAWLQAVLATHSNVVPSQRTIEELLGSSSPAYAQDIAYLHGLYRQVSDDPTVQLKRDLWARLLRSALGTGFEDQDRKSTRLNSSHVSISYAVFGLQKKNEFQLT